MENKSRILIVPDSFKNSLTADEVAEELLNGLSYYKNKILVKSFPFADGGEGSLEVVSRFLEAEERTCYTFDPFLKPIRASYLLQREKNVAYIEAARVIGLEILEKDPDCFHASSYGLGILIEDALSQGVSEIFLFLGGSATCDAGVGMASALGYEFIKDKRLLERPYAKDIIDIDEIKNDKILPELKYCKFNIAFDVTNPLFGPDGAAKVFSRQKGANDEEIDILDSALQKMNDIHRNNTGVIVQDIEGSGAAGGLGAGGIMFLNGKLKSAFKILSEISGLEKEVSDHDIIITGEGHIDDQSFNGKLISQVQEIAKKFEKEIWLVCAIRSISQKEALQNGFDKIESLYRSMPSEINVHESRKKLYDVGKKWAAELLKLP